MTEHLSLDWAVEIISMCEPIRCHQGGMWFGRNHNFADATFVDYGAADAFAVAARALPTLVTEIERLRSIVSRTAEIPYFKNERIEALVRDAKDALAADQRSVSLSQATREGE